jgi:hypothetical protein
MPHGYRQRLQKSLFKRWDNITENDEPEVVIFFATPDVLSGLFTLSGYDREDMHGNIAPFGAGCASIVQYPLLESKKRKTCSCYRDVRYIGKALCTGKRADLCRSFQTVCGNGFVYG